MKKSLSILILGVLPGLALASGEHAGGHDKQGGGHGMMQMSGMEGMSHGGHDDAMGQAGDPAKVSRTIDVTMADTMRFTPDQIKVKAGETIRFFVKNAGKIPHEMVIGSMNELKEHAEMMRKMPGMQHAEPNMITLKPGQRGSIVWQFDKAGTVDFACLVPGHMEAGMVGKIEAE
ncbi:MAG: cupredoxin domain-containing protein [Burkholderiales bacterium]